MWGEGLSLETENATSQRLGADFCSTIEHFETGDRPMSSDLPWGDQRTVSHQDINSWVNATVASKIVPGRLATGDLNTGGKGVALTPKVAVIYIKQHHLIHHDFNPT